MKNSMKKFAAKDARKDGNWTTNSGEGHGTAVPLPE
jgi:hypothetical protein